MAAGAAVPGRVVAQAPRADVQARAQVDVLAAVVLFALLKRMALAGAGAVVQDAGGDPLVEFRWVNIAAGNLAEGGLRNAQQKLLVADAKRRRRRRYGLQIRAFALRGKLRLVVGFNAQAF